MRWQILFSLAPGSDNYPQNAALWFLPCLFVTEMLFLGFFLLVNKAGSVETKTVMGGWRNRIAVMALALVSFLSIIVMWSLDLPVDQFRLPWALISCPSPCCSTASVTC